MSNATYRLDDVKKEFPEILRSCLGIVSTACKKVGIERKTYYNWRYADQSFADACDEVQEYVCDFVEGKLYGLIQQGHPGSIQYYLKTKGRRRGYGESIELTADSKQASLDLTPDENAMATLERYIEHKINERAQNAIRQIELQLDDEERHDVDVA